MKLQNMVKFPLSGLDMTPHVVKRSQSSWSLPSHWSPWRRPYGLGRDPEDCVYDLYAVCNHRGAMHGGHYTGPQRGGADRTPAPAPGRPGGLLPPSPERLPRPCPASARPRLLPCLGDGATRCGAWGGLVFLRMKVKFTFLFLKQLRPSHEI